ARARLADRRRRARQGPDDRRRAGPPRDRHPRRARARARHRRPGGLQASRAAHRQGRPARQRAAHRPAAHPHRGGGGGRTRHPDGRDRGGHTMTRTLIRGGLVITASDETTADVLIEDEKVVALADPAFAQGWTADTIIDATGKYVIPGGVDAHTHMEMPFGGTFASDTFETGTRAAAWGGCTSLVVFALQSMGGSLREGLDAWHAKPDGNCAIDYSFHMILADVNDGTLKEMEALVGEGISSFKL